MDTGIVDDHDGKGIGGFMLYKLIKGIDHDRGGDHLRRRLIQRLPWAVQETQNILALTA